MSSRNRFEDHFANERLTPDDLLDLAGLIGYASNMAVKNYGAAMAAEDSAGAILLIKYRYHTY